MTDRVQQNKLIVVDELTMADYKTKEFVQVMDNLKASGKTLVIMADKDDHVIRSASNVPAVKTTLTSQINVYDLMNAQTVILTKDAIAKLEEVYA